MKSKTSLLILVLLVLIAGILIYQNKNNKESEELTISNMEGHPNPIAHLMFAERLFAEITCNSELGFTNKCSKFSPGRINFLTFLEKI